MSSSLQGESSASQVAVVVTVYNKAPYVRACLESVLAQTWPAFELVVVDDGSTDDSRQIVQSVIAATPAIFLRLANGGVSKARSIGYAASSKPPKYVLFLDGDDVLLPEALHRMVAHMEQHAAVTMCYSVPMLIDAMGKELGVDTDQVRWEQTPLGRRRLADTELDTPIEAIWSHFRAMPSACLIRCSAYTQTRGWDEQLCRPARPFQVEDKDMAIQLALIGPVHRIGVATFQYRVLPTVHRQSLYDGLLAIDRKWWHAPLEPAIRRIVRRAIRFDSRVVLLDAAGELRASLGSGSLRAVLTASRKLLRTAARFVFLPLRLRPSP